MIGGGWFCAIPNADVTRNEGEVSAGNASGIAVVDNNRAVPEEGGRPMCGGEIEVGITVYVNVSRISAESEGQKILRDLERVGRNVAMLAREVADLAICGIIRVARRILAANKWIEMCFGASAVPIRRHRLVVDVVF